MKKRFLKNYETFKDEKVNENTHYNYGFDKFQTISEEEESTEDSKEDTKEVAESEEDTKECDCGKGEKCDCGKKEATEESEEDSKEECDCGKPDCDCAKKEATEESEEDVDDTKVGVIAIGLDTEDDNDKTDDEVDSSIAVDADDNGTQDITNSFNPLESTAREFSVAKIMTKNGAKIMMCYTCDAEDLSTLADNIDFQSACKMVETESESNGLEKFDNANDVNLGGIPSFMMDKKVADSESTSYRP